MRLTWANAVGLADTVEIVPCIFRIMVAVGVVRLFARVKGFYRHMRVDAGRPRCCPSVLNVVLL